jgi:antitoxin component YwqK of YwqJK toxin-antitoxin module
MRLISLFCLLSWVASAQPRKYDNVLTNGDTTVYIIKEEGKVSKAHFYLNGKRIFSRFWTYYESGSYFWEQKIGTGPFAKRNGPATYYYENGQVSNITHYRNDKIVGPCVEYYPSGIVRSFCTRHVLKNKLDGLTNSYYPNGKVHLKQVFRNGRLMDVLAYRDEEGNDLYFGTLKNGNGTFISYCKGEPFVEYTFKNGQLKRYKLLGNKKNKRIPANGPISTRKN